MSNVTIKRLPERREATVQRRIAEGHPLHDGGPGAVVETYWLPHNRPGSIYVKTNRGGPKRKALIHLAVDGDPYFNLVADPENLESTISNHSHTQLAGLQATVTPARCSINPWDEEECEACQ